MVNLGWMKILAETLMPLLVGIAYTNLVGSHKKCLMKKTDASPGKINYTSYSYISCTVPP